MICFELPFCDGFLFDNEKNKEVSMEKSWLITRMIDIDRLDSIDVVPMMKHLYVQDFHIDSNGSMMLDVMFHREVSSARLLYKKDPIILQRTNHSWIFNLKFFRFRQYLHRNKIEKTMRSPPSIPLISTMNARLLWLIYIRAA